MKLSEGTFDQFQNMLIEESGLYFTRDRLTTLQDRLSERLKVCQRDTFEDYFHYLKFHTQGKLELKALLEVLTISETFFFRNEPQFEALQEYVIPLLIKSKQALPGAKTGIDAQVHRPQIRIWCAGCSTGEEPYTIAILLRELLPDFRNWDISILATDINSRILETAQEGIYGSRAVHLVPQQYLEKYFERKGQRFWLSGEIKNMVRFQYQNLARDPYTLPEMLGLDILFCRNVLIYFDLDTLKRVISQFEDCLTPDGYLFIGHSETLWNISNAFRPIEFPQTFIYQMMPDSKSQIVYTPLIPLPEVHVWNQSQEENVEGSGYDESLAQLKNNLDLLTGNAYPEIEKNPLVKEVQENQDREAPAEMKEGFIAYEKKEYDRALHIFNAYLKHHPHEVKILMIRGIVLANLGMYDDSLECLEDLIKKDNLHGPAYFLRGILFSKKGDYTHAIEEFKRALYIDESLSMAYFNLGNLYRFLKKPEQAKKEFLNCLKVLKTANENDFVPFSEGVTTGVLQQAAERALECVIV